MLEPSDPRSRIMILLLASSGCRIGALPKLKISDLIPVEEYNLYKVVIYDRLRKHAHFTFSTPEARKTIDAYLSFRERRGEKVTPNSTIFGHEFNRDDQFVVLHPKLLTKHAFMRIIDTAAIKSSVKTVTRQIENSEHPARQRHQVYLTNGFRKFFNTNLVRAKVNSVAKKILMDHSLVLEDNYYRPGSDEILREDLKAVDLLTVNEENRLRIIVEEVTAKQTV
jgi:hypothetical protein